MKKTAQSLLTAAVFASALGTTVASATASDPSGSNLPSAIVSEEAVLMDLSLSTTVTTVYGPPSYFTTTAPKSSDSEEDTTTDSFNLTDITTTPQVLYGPMVYLGDANFDRKVDAKDLQAILDNIRRRREAVANGEPMPSLDWFERYGADMNRDGSITKEDADELLKFLLTKPDEPVVTTTTSSTTQVVYGTTAAYTTDKTINTETFPTGTTAQLVYGPPPAWHEK